MLSTVITIFSSCPLLALTATERWRAARSFTSGGANTMTEQWFIIAGVVAICVLAVLFVMVTLKRMRSEIKTSNRWFAEYARKRGLSAREQQIMLEIANLMGIKRKESLFTLPFAFDKGAESLMRKNLHDVEKSQVLKIELAFLRQKLGFGRMKVPPVQTKWATVKKTKLSSRQIPVGDKLYLTDNDNYELVDVECEVR